MCQIIVHYAIREKITLYRTNGGLLIAIGSISNHFTFQAQKKIVSNFRGLHSGHS
jgi:hypothetical protein